jgi:hypothetical protein
LKRNTETPIETHFIDSTPLIAPFMNSKKTQNGFSLTKGLNFLGRSGVKLINGLRVAYISGTDFDVLGGSTLTQSAQGKFIGNYFLEEDLQAVLADYNTLLK